MRVFGHWRKGVSVFVMDFYGELLGGYQRVLGFLQVNDKAWFPAYAPLGVDVAADLNLVFPDLVWDASALEVLARCKQAIEDIEARVYPSVPVRYEPYPHQVEALAHAYHRPRLAIEYDMGLGKTKIAIDTLRALKVHAGVTPTLLLCPSHVQDTWSKEIAEHDVDNTLTVRRLLGKRGGVPTAEVRHKIYAQESENPSDVLIVNFELVQNDLEHLVAIHKSRGGFMQVVVDEAHGLASSGAKRTEAVLEVIKGISRRLCLTGTPTMGDPLNRWTLCQILIPSLTPTERQFKIRYADVEANWLCTKCFAKQGKPLNVKPEPCKRRPDECKWKIERETVIAYRNLHHLKTILEKYVSIIKTKEECLTLPPREIVDVPIEMTKELKDAYNAMLTSGMYSNPEVLGAAVYHERSPAIRNIRLLQITSGYIRLAEKSTLDYMVSAAGSEDDVLRADDFDDGIDCDVPVPRGWKDKSVEEQTAPQSEEAGTPQIIRIATSPKITQLRLDVETYVLKEGRKMIVWAHETPEMDDVAALLDAMQVRYVRIDGSSDSKTKTALRAAFNENEGIRVYLSQISINAGFTINAASVTIYYSLSYKVVDYQQSRDRNYRIGQGAATLIRRYYVPGSVSDCQRKALGKKEKFDDGLRKRQLCMACPLVESCMEQNIFPFDARCKVMPSRTAKMRSQLKELK
jgi:SNF2 family DNA or RNA helicase